jgi:uncharacterized protein (TIGR02246 family)
MRRIAIVFLLFLSAGDDDRAAIRASSTAFDGALNAGNAKQAAALFIEDGSFTSPAGNGATGRAQIEKIFGGALAGPLKGSTHTTTLRTIHFVTPDVAVADGEVTLARPNLPTAKAFLTEVQVKRGGRWLLADVRAYVFMDPHP